MTIHPQTQKITDARGRTIPTPDAIRQLRETHNLTMSELGTRLGVSSRTVESWEQGRRNPSKTTIMLIANTLI